MKKKVNEVAKLSYYLTYLLLQPLPLPLPLLLLLSSLILLCYMSTFLVYHTVYTYQNNAQINSTLNRNFICIIRVLLPIQCHTLFIKHTHLSN